MVWYLAELNLVEQMIFPPRYGPEWGSGGIFGLKHHRGTLYFTLAFEAMAYFIKDDKVRRYTYDLVGPGPRSGGDTYNAVEAVDEYIYFGGWVHAPAVYLRDTKGAQILFRNKYSHVHSYNIYDDSIKLLWKESLGHESEWVGEISEIVYDPVNDRLLLARGDGMTNLGVYQIDRKGSNYRRISEVPAQKGSYLFDHVCFDMFKNWVDGVDGIQCVDLVEDRITYSRLSNIEKISIDEGNILWRLPGAATSAYGRFFLFIRGGVLIGNPIDGPGSITFYRLFDFRLSGFGPRRTMVKPFAGGILIAFNSYSEAIMKPIDEYEKIMSKASNTIVAPSILLYVTPPMAKVVAVFGARITGFEVINDKIIVAYNTMANTFRYDALPIDAGFRGFTVIDHNLVYRDPPTIRFAVRGFQVGNNVFGGIPLSGYKEPRLKIFTAKSNRLHIYEYDLSLPPEGVYHDTYSLSQGKNTIELSSYRNSVVSFKLDEEDNKAVIKIDLM